MNEQTQGDRFFEEYCESLGYSVTWEPYPASPRMPDFAVRTPDGGELVAEVKTIESRGMLGVLPGRRLGRIGTRSIGDAVAPLRKAIRDAAGQLRPLQGKGLPLVVVLVPGPGCGVPLDPVSVLSAMYGDISVEFDIGPVSDSRWVTGRDGRLSGGTHAYLSAVVVLRVRLHADDWAESWWSVHAPPGDGRIELIEQFMAAARAQAPDGYYLTADVYETLGAAATRLPDSVFVGAKDTRWVPSSDGSSMVRVR